MTISDGNLWVHMILITLKLRDCRINVEEGREWIADIVENTKAEPNLCTPKIHSFNLVPYFLSTVGVGLFNIHALLKNLVL